MHFFLFLSVRPLQKKYKQCMGMQEEAFLYLSLLFFKARAKKNGMRNERIRSVTVAHMPAHAVSQRARPANTRV